MDSGSKEGAKVIAAYRKAAKRNGIKWSIVICAYAANLGISRDIMIKGHETVGVNNRQHIRKG